MDENEKITSPEEVDKTSNDGCGCFLWPYTIVSIMTGILWIVWLIQGRPDIWYGKLFRLQWRVTIGFVVIAAGIAVIYGVVNCINTITAKWKMRKGDGEHHEEER